MNKPKLSSHGSFNNDDVVNMLGKRHRYDEAGPPSLRRTARLLGFSPKEISELERVYRIDLKETKQ